MKALLLLSLLVAVSPAPAASPPVFKVMTIPIAMFAQESDMIIEATVTKIEGVEGARVASCTPTATWKGKPDEVVQFLASRTWTCDISTAVQGERVVLFLKAGDSGQLSIYHSGRGRMLRREFEGREYESFYGDISFPENSVTSFDELSRASYSCGVELSELKRLVAEAIEAARQAAEQEAGK